MVKNLDNKPTQLIEDLGVTMFDFYSELCRTANVLRVELNMSPEYDEAELKLYSLDEKKQILKKAIDATDINMQYIANKRYNLTINEFETLKKFIKNLSLAGGVVGELRFHTGFIDKQLKIQKMFERIERKRNKQSLIKEIVNKDSFNKNNLEI